ncbi:hypothetical protein HNP12_000667 [Aeromonas hydrophila]|uniref:hypothetical protein n=1 Tax=Aeromonas hydrophila TaxID=644 RepID=UPI002167A12A|nr:hypothetical protein [Aeromonas hydrophila]MCS3766619.1 hypothetical protein [Aeromonas hydrophila]
MSDVFVTTMYRWGDREAHSYVVGVFSSDKVALAAGRREERNRGGKYLPCVEQLTLDHDGSRYEREFPHKVILGLPDQRKIILRNIKGNERIGPLIALAVQYHRELHSPAPRMAAFCQTFLALTEDLK